MWGCGKKTIKLRLIKKEETNIKMFLWNVTSRIQFQALIINYITI